MLFYGKAATVIVLASVGVWWLAQFPTGEIQSSYLARIGQAIEPAFQVVGFDWRMVVSLLTSVIAKENAIGTLAILLGCSDQNFSEVVRQVYFPCFRVEFFGCNYAVCALCTYACHDLEGVGFLEMGCGQRRDYWHDFPSFGSSGLQRRKIIPMTRGEGMIDKLVSILRSGEPLTIGELAQRLDTTPELVELMLQELVARGILRPVGEACVQSCTVCGWRGACLLKGTGRGYILVKPNGDQQDR